jgi:hypothetical protein
MIHACRYEYKEKNNLCMYPYGICACMHTMCFAMTMQCTRHVCTDEFTIFQYHFRPLMTSCVRMQPISFRTSCSAGTFSPNEASTCTRVSFGNYLNSSIRHVATQRHNISENACSATTVTMTIHATVTVTVTKTAHRDRDCGCICDSDHERDKKCDHYHDRDQKTVNMNVSVVVTVYTTAPRI